MAGLQPPSVAWPTALSRTEKPRFMKATATFASQSPFSSPGLSCCPCFSLQKPHFPTANSLGLHTYPPLSKVWPAQGIGSVWDLGHSFVWVQFAGLRKDAGPVNFLVC